MKDCAIVQQHKEKTMKRKRQPNGEAQARDGDLISKASGLAQLPNVPCLNCEDEASLLAHEEAIRKEIRKSNPNWNIVENKMSLTFPKRVKLVQEDHTLARDIIAAYPIFRHDGEVLKEFSRLTKEDCHQLLQSVIER